MALLILTVGLPRSGKSTWARAHGAPIVCPDAIRLAMHGQRFVDSAEPFVWATAKLMVMALFRAGHETVIVDATNVSKKRRREWEALVQPDGKPWLARVEFKVFDASPEECVRRAHAEGDDEIREIIYRQEESWDLPRPSSWTPLL